MSTRKQRHEGNNRRGYADLNKSFGISGLMESETLYIALTAVRAGSFDTAEQALVEHYGSLELARRSFATLEGHVAQRYQEVFDGVG